MAGIQTTASPCFPTIPRVTRKIHRSS